MAQCDLEGTVKYLEDLYVQLAEDKKTSAAKQSIKALIDDISGNRNRIQQASNFAGSERININKPFEVIDFTPTPAPAVTEKSNAKSTPTMRTFGGVTTYFFKKGASELKNTLAFTKYDDKGIPYIVLQEGITKEEFMLYAAGKRDNSKSSIQKSVVNEYMKDVYGIDLMAELSNLDNTQIQQFIIKHELRHIANADNVDTYYKDKNQTLAGALGMADTANALLSDSAIMIEVRANVEALKNSFAAINNNTGIVTLNDVAPITSIINETTEDVTSEEEEEDISEKTYKISDTQNTNSGQSSAIDTMIKWFNRGNMPSFLLQGRGGTGKTTVINVLLKELGIRSDEVIFAAPTNKAKKVLAEANKNTSYARSGYYTVAQLLAIKPMRSDSGVQTFKEDYFADKPNIPKILVVDEASMLHSENYAMLMGRVKEVGGKVIFMGDNAQLPPIGDKKAPVKSIVFNTSKEVTAGLSQLMRQQKDSPIINLTDKLIRIVNRVESILLEGKTSAQDLKQSINSVLFDGDKLSKFNDTTNEGVILTTEDFTSILPSFLRDFKKNPKGTKFITYNNHTHSYTLQKVKTIRRSLFGDRADKEEFIHGEPLMLNGPYQTTNSKGETVFLDNGEEFTVKSSITKSKHIKYRVGKNFISTAKPLEVYEITAVDNITGATFVFDKPVGSREVVNAFIENEKANTVANGAKAGGAYLLNEVLAQDLAHGYIINSHRSQGSTYDAVYLDLGNIAGQQYAQANDIIKSLYVAASRPRKKLVVIDGRGSNGQIINARKVAGAEFKPEMFENVDNAEASDIIDKINKCNGKG